jgi:DNA-binding response OmpR family regulator
MSNNDREILIVESDQPTAELYRRALSKAYQVFTCADERTALNLIRTRPIRAVVLEPAIGGGQGWQLLAAIRRACDSHAIPIVLCSTLDERRRGMELGAESYLVKPTLPQTLQDTLQRLIPLPDRDGA